MLSKKKLLFVAGARPNFMKIAPMIREFRTRSDRFECSLVHTGQHYDESMSAVFFDQLGIPEPDYSLNVGSGSHAAQTARIMIAFEPVCEKIQPDCVILVGDVNSTIACALVAKKLNMKVAHVEAGLRSGDRSMPEEINRIATDAISDLFFVTEESGIENLQADGHPDSSIFFVGHVMIDNLYFELRGINEGAAVSDAAFRSRDGLGRYGVATLHRPSNVDHREQLTAIILALEEIAETIPLIFPMHPRTKQKIGEFGITLSERIRVTEPLGYRDFLWIWKDSALILTDSGGLQEESTALGIPCLTLRENTERPITVTMGTNRLVGNDSRKIVNEAKLALEDGPREFTKPPLWDGLASARIADILENVL